MKKSTELAYKYNLTDIQVEQLWRTWWKVSRETVSRYYDKKGNKANCLNIMFKPLGQLMFSLKLEQKYKHKYDREYKENQADVNTGVADKRQVRRRPKNEERDSACV